VQKAGIKVLVTLHHFSNPMWFENMGAFEHPDSPAIFLEYVRYTVKALADLADEWITINEPNVYAVNGYFFGEWPPGKKNFRALQNVYKNIAVSHILAYKEIHAIRRAAGVSPGMTRVSFANHLRIFKPLHAWNIFHVISSSLMEKAFQGSLTDAFSRGVFSFPVGKPDKKPAWGNIERGRYYDFIGVNYYTRTAVSFLKNGFFPKKPVNDLGWEIYPQGIVECARMMYEKYHAPIYITENGTCDKNDTFRSRYIFDHLKSLVDSGLPVERYYHWTFLDNFEWAEGECAPFGIVSLNFETQERAVKRSGRFFTQIIENGGVTEAMHDEFVR
jgi:beta-glucosidase